MSDSVGKISLDLEVQSDLNKQISDIANQIGKGLKTSLDGGLKNAFEGMRDSSQNSMSNLSRVIDKSMSRMSKGLKKRLSSIFNSFQQIKAPTFQFPQPQSSAMPQMSVSQAHSVRGPPQINTEVIRAQIDTLGRTLDNTNARIEQQNAKLKLLREQYSATFNQNRKNKLSEQILKTEANINRLTATSDKLGFKLSDLDSKLSQTSGASSKVSNGMNAINQSTKKATMSARLFGDRMKKNTQQMRSYRSGIGMIIRSMIIWGMVFPMVMRGLSALGTYIGQSLMTNQQFANSLAQIKTNLMVAFTPIFQAILPALNALMSALSTATAYIASFISAIFGKTYQQSYQATQGLIDAKTAMGAYGDSASNAAKKVKGALAGFDEVNTLNIQDDANSMGGAGGSGAPTLTQPSIETSSIDSVMKELVDKIKAYFNTFNFEPLIKSFDRLKKSIEPIINNLGKILKWFLTDILDPLARWTISDLLPAFLNLLAGVLDFLNPLLEVFMSLGSWLWDSFLQPIASWTGGVIVDVLNGLADKLSDIGDWISENKPLVEDLTLVLGSFALAWGLVTAAVGLWNIVGAIATGVTTAFGLAIAFLTSPIGLTILAIGAIIAIGVLLYKHWDVLKVKAIEVWNGIKAKFEEFKNWLGNVFATDWSEKFGMFGDILNGFSKNVQNIFDSVQRIFQGVIDFIVGVFTGDWERAWSGVVNIFGGIMDGLSAVVKAPLNAVISLINATISGLNKINVSIPDWVPGFGGKNFGINIPKIPMLAKGGILDSPTLAMVGEAGKEAVVPLENNTQGLDLLASKLLERMPIGPSNSSQTTPQEVVVKIDSKTLIRVLLPELQKENNRVGNPVLVFN